MSKTVILDEVNPNSAKFRWEIIPKRNFKIFISDIASAKQNGSSDFGKMVVRFIEDGGMLIQEEEFNLTNSFSTFEMIYDYTTTLPLVKYIDMFVYAVNDGIEYTQIRWDGEIELQVEKFIVSPIPNEIYFTGWVQPDQLSRSFMTNQYFISMTATDGLGDLKKVQFPFDYSIANGLANVVSVLKKSLEPTGLLLNFKSQLNISEEHFSGDDTVLKDIYVNPLKFVEFKNGKVKFANSYEAIEKLLGSFNARLFQSSGHYYIVQNNEVNSKLQTIEWNLLSASTVNYDRSYSDVTKVLVGTDELSKVRPLKSIQYTFNDLNLGNYITEYDGTFGDGVTDQNWQVLEYPAQVSLATGATPFFGDCIKYEMNFGDAPLMVERHWRMNGLPVNIPPKMGSTVNISWDTIIDEITFLSGDRIPRLKIELWSYDGIDSSGNTINKIMDSVTVDVLFGQIKSNIVNLKYTDNDTTIYYCLVYFTQEYSSADTITAYFDNFRIFRNNDSDLTEHILYTGELSNNALDLLEDEIDFGTSDSYIDSGALLYAPSAVTTTWSNYGGSENMKLQNLLLKNKLTENQRFRNYLRLTVKTDSIRFNQLIAIIGKLYQITAYSFDLMNNNLQLELVEHTSTPVTVTYTEEKLQGEKE